MSQYYTKINTCFKRDLDHSSKLYNCIMPEWGLTTPEFELLKDLKWEATEKIDGTNMSYHYSYRQKLDGVSEDLEIHGKTDKAQIPVHLLSKMQELVTTEKLREVFVKDDTVSLDVQIFGEGYGIKIQKGGNYIKDGVDFILFDVKIGNVWLTREACEDSAARLGIKVVPLIGERSIPEAIEFVKEGFKSRIAENKDYDAEGLVLKAPLGLLDRRGERIITKIKTCDFRQRDAKEKTV